MGDNLVELLARALKLVREMDHVAAPAWRFPHCGVPVRQPTAAHRRYSSAYLGNCAWIWQRIIPLAEQQRVRDALVRLWLEDGLDLDFSRPNEVSSFVLMFQEAASAIPARQEALRQELSRSLPISAFPGIDIEIPGMAAAKEMLGALFPPSMLRSPSEGDKVIALNQLNQRILRAEECGDQACLDSLLHRNFTIVRANGEKQDRQIFLDAVDGNKNRGRSADQSEILFYGSCAVFTCRITTKHDKNGKEVVGHFWNTRMFLRQDEGWLCGSWQVMKIRDD